MSLVFILAGLILLYFGAESLVKGASALAERMGVSPLAIGLTVVAYGTSAPEMTVSISSSWAGAGDIAAANVVGSNIFNAAFILGLTALICPVGISLSVIRKDMPVMIGVSLLGWYFLGDGRLARLEGIILFALSVAYSWLTLRAADREGNQPETDSKKRGKPGLMILWVILGLAGLVAGSKLLVTGAIRIAETLGMSQAVIGLTIVSVGTSLPELATSVVAALKREADIAIGNVVGSNIFNILAILGATGVAKPFQAAGIGNLDWAIMLITAIVLLPMMRSGFKLNRWEGGVLLLFYVGYVLYLLHHNISMASP